MSEETQEEAVKADPEAEATEAATPEESSKEEPTAAEEAPEKEYTDAEKQAMAGGWNPEGPGEGKPHKTAEQFLNDGSFMKKIDELHKSYRKEIRDLKHEVHAQRKGAKEAEARGYEQALTDLAKTKREAVEIGDIDAFEAVEKQEADVRTKLEAANAEINVQPPTEPAPETAEFMERNKDWFNQDTTENLEMSQTVLRMEQDLLQSKPYLTNSQLIREVEKEIKTLYPHRFKKETKKAAPAAVVSETAAKTEGKAKGKKLSAKDLSPGQQAALKEFMKVDPSATADEYIKYLELTKR